MRLFCLLASLAAAACQQPAKSGPLPAGSNAAASASVAVASTPLGSALPAKHPFQGSWHGPFQAELFRMQPAAGAVKEWRLDDGKVGTGPGKLTLEVATDGSIAGGTTGALGELSVSGYLDLDRAALTLTSTQPDGFHGTILASQTPEGLRGTLTASSGDSLRLRRADITFSRSAP